MKATGPRTLKDRKEVGIELRKTHFSLGTDNREYNSQYRHDYLEHPLGHLDGPKMDSVLLRKTHFKLGDFKNPYNTTTMEQNKEIEHGRARSVVELDQNVKNDLRKSHFILGNFEPNYNTMFRSEYYNKSNIKDNSHTDAKAIEKALRTHNYVLGNDKPDYKSETAAKYTTPTGLTRPNEHKISTQELQKSHYVFGNNNDPWTTTTMMSYYPKELQAKRFTKDLTRTNFVLGEDRPDFKSVHQDTFVPHQYSKSNEVKELKDDLRRHHFVFGNEGGDQMVSIQKQDYSDPKLDNQKIQANKIDAFFLRASHFALGDKSQMPVDQYETTYGSTMKPKNPVNEQKKENMSFKSSININGDGPLSYQTESRSNFIPKTNNISEKEIKVMKSVMNDIRGHHFALGEDRNDFRTTTGSTYQYDPNRAAGAKGALDAELKTDLRATHYKLGYMPDNHQTTHQSSYVPMPLNPTKFKDPQLRKSHIDLNTTNKNLFEGRTIYMTDFTKKELEI